MRLTIEKTIDYPANEIWTVLGDKFALISEWFSLVEFSRPITEEEIPKGLVPLKTAPVFGRYTESAFIKATEVLTLYSKNNMEFEFDAFGAPGFMVSLTRNRTKVVEVNPSVSIVQINVEVKFKHIFNILAPLMKKRLTKMFNKSLEELELTLKK